MPYTRKDIEEKLKKEKDYLKNKFKVEKIGIFGSYARNEARDDSDIDLLVEFNENIGWEFIDLKDYLESKLNKKVDLVTVDALKPQLKSSILNEVIYQ
ncbi:MAG: uncharacterized protein PWR10_2360 [Halanaerobiales bacterium]|nr:uncharacterized protein [Halanaerobiales bacterium]